MLLAQSLGRSIAATCRLDARSTLGGVEVETAQGDGLGHPGLGPHAGGSRGAARGYDRRREQELLQPWNAAQQTP